MSLDGYIGSASSDRLILSNEQDFEELDARRAEVDAVMVGANTLRLDNPRLLVKSKDRQLARERAGLSSQPLLVTFTVTGNLSTKLNFFNQPQTSALIYCDQSALPKLQERNSPQVQIQAIGKDGNLDFSMLLEDLVRRGVKKLLIEGGEQTNSAFLRSGMVDAIELSIAPRFVGARGGARFVCTGAMPLFSEWQVKNCRALGDMCVCLFEVPRE